MSIGNKLKQLRKQNKLTQEQMSEKLLMEQPNYSKYENDKIPPTTIIIDRIAKTFNVSEEWLLSNENMNINIETININDNGVNVVNAEKYYYIPKDILDNLIHSLNTLVANIDTSK